MGVRGPAGRDPLSRVAASARYGSLFLAEVLIFWVIVVAVNSSGYGADTSWHARLWYAPVALLMIAVAMALGEARFRFYRRVWSVASLNDAFAIGLGVVEATLIVELMNLLFPDGYRPLRVLAPILAAPAVVIGIGLLRLLPRLLLLGRQSGNRLLVVIPDAGAYTTVKALVQQQNPEWSPIAVVTADNEPVGGTLLGIPVVGRARNLRKVIKEVSPQGVAFVQTRSSDRAEARRLYAVCLAEELPVFVVPAADGWFPAPGASRLRQLSADDLVGRDERQIDLASAASHVAGRTVMVTGAAGSIGSELCRLVAGMQPARLVLVDTNESALFDLGEELHVSSSADLRQALVSIVDREQLAALFQEERPDVVFHAAAYKHVPMLEAHPLQAVMTNVVGTWNTLRCAGAAETGQFILISTDKAASRHSVMGCTKRLCEQLVLAHEGPMKCWAVRFGNVVGSRGSVVPLFERQIEHGGPVTITHADVSRYMMTITEAASLVLSSLGTSKAGHLYMLDMGEPIKIYDLAQALIRSRGMRPGVDIKIVETGLRPGERMTEDLLAPEEGWRPTDHPAIREVVSPSAFNAEDLDWTMARLEQLAREGRADDVVHVLKNAVQRPVSAGEDTASPSERPQHQESA